MERRGLSACVCLTILLVSACANPPNPEMDRAEGAIDAARAAGAEQYAPAEYAAATAALKSAHDAVAAGDYRLALNYALTSHERAQNAARDTADTKARMRVEVERGLAEADTLIAEGEARLETVRRVRTQRRLAAQAAEELAAASADVQKAREATAAGDYPAASKILEEIRDRVQEILAEITAATPQPARRRR